MTRALSGAVLIAIAVAVVWFAPASVFFLTGQALLVLAFAEYARLAAACGLPIPAVACGRGGDGVGSACRPRAGWVTTWSARRSRSTPS